MVVICCCYAIFKARMFERTVEEKVQELKIKAKETLKELEEGLEEEIQKPKKAFSSGECKLPLIEKVCYAPNLSSTREV